MSREVVGLTHMSDKMQAMIPWYHESEPNMGINNFEQETKKLLQIRMIHTFLKSYKPIEQ